MNNAGNTDWLFLAIGLLFIAGAVFDFARGNTSSSLRHRLGFRYSVNNDGMRNPIQFPIPLMIALVVGVFPITIGIKKPVK